MAAQLPPGPGRPGVNDFRWIFQPIALQESAKARYGDIWSLRMARIGEEELARWPMHEPIQLLPRLEAIGVRIILSVVYGLRAGPSYDELLARVRRLIEFGDSNIRMLRFFLAARREAGKAPQDF